MPNKNSNNECPKCGSVMIKKSEKETFDGTVIDWKCPKCGNEIQDG